MNNNNAHTTWLQHQIYDWRNSSRKLDEYPSEIIADFEARLSPDEKKVWDTWDESNKTFTICKYLNRQEAIRQAERLGYAIHPEIQLSHNSYALVGYAKGMEAGVELAKQYGFYDEAVRQWGTGFFPGSMWDIVAKRPDGDALILFIGDDRGWANNWEYYVAVAWEPQALVDEKGYSSTI